MTANQAKEGGGAMRKVKPTTKRPTRQPATNDSSPADSRSRQVARPQVPMLASRIEKIVDHINEQYRNQLRLQYDGRTITVEILALDSQVVLSAVKPLRPQLVESNEQATITSRMESTKGEPMYLVLYKAADCRQVQQWWSESDLVAA